MTIVESTAAILGTIFFVGYLVVADIFRRLDELREDIRDFARIQLQDAEERDVGVRRHLDFVQRDTTTVAEGVTDLRAHIENQ